VCQDHITISSDFKDYLPNVILLNNIIKLIVMSYNNTGQLIYFQRIGMEWQVNLIQMKNLKLMNY
jgi:hypothetical protein